MRSIAVGSRTMAAVVRRGGKLRSLAMQPAGRLNTSAEISPCFKCPPVCALLKCAKPLLQRRTLIEASMCRPSFPIAGLVAASLSGPNMRDPQTLRGATYHPTASR